VFDTDDGKNAIVWVYDLSGATSPRQLTFEGKNRFPIWTPDGQRITFQSERDGKVVLVSQMADGATPAEQLIAPEEGKSLIPDSWTPDRKYLFFQNGQSARVDTIQTRAPSDVALWRFSAAEKKAEPFGTVRSVTSIAPIAATISPDGRWVAYTVGSQPNRASLQLYVQSLSGAGARYLIAQGAADPQWSPDSKGLPQSACRRRSFDGNHDAAVRRSRQPGCVTDAVGQHFSPHASQSRDAAKHRPDAGRPAFRRRGSTRDGGGAGTQQIEIVLNWFEELKARVPR
jgi:dipeptidyl aminopeptidase/acylaminoacyl peptidase